MEIVIIVNTPPMTKNMNVEQVHLKDSLSAQLNSVNMLNSIKGKITDRDRDRDNNQTGAAGPQGPSGITQLNATNVYSVNNSTAAQTDTFAILGALCDPGDLVLNGGYNLIGSTFDINDTHLATVIDQSITNATLLGAGWLAALVFNGEDREDISIRLNVNSLCFDNPPLR
jgi:hypothetical protein